MSTDADSLAGPLLGAVPRPARRRAARSDRALVRAAQAGSETAFAELFERNWAAAHRAAWLVVHDAAAAEDIAQEAFVAAVRALDRFDRRRPFAPWLHRIVVNRAIDHARAQALRREEWDADPADHGVEDPEPGGQDAVVAALATLPADQRAVVVLRHLLEYPPGETAGLPALPRGPVNPRLRRGLDALGRGLEQEERA